MQSRKHPSGLKSLIWQNIAKGGVGIGHIYIYVELHKNTFFRSDHVKNFLDPKLYCVHSFAPINKTYGLKC